MIKIKWCALNLKKTNKKQKQDKKTQKNFNVERHVAAPLDGENNIKHLICEALWEKQRDVGKWVFMQNA